MLALFQGLTEALTGTPSVRDICSRVTESLTRDSRIAHCFKNTFIKRKCWSKEWCGFIQSCLSILFNKVDTHATWEKEIYCIRLCSPKGGKLGSIICLS